MLPSNDYQSLQTLIEQRTGLHFGDTKHKELCRHIDTAMKHLGITEPSLYYAHLQGSFEQAGGWDDLIRLLTVGETYFFRDSAQCAVLRNHILPSIIERHRVADYPTLRIWSAGCSTGEEAYTIAILLKEILPDYDNWNITLLATDINRASLTAAARGIYKERSFRLETPAYIRQHYFHQTTQGYELIPEIRQKVSFAYLNLAEDSYPSFANFTSNLDLIICRNVTIYFQHETTRQIVRRFHAALDEEGWLVVGHSEPMSSLYEGFEARNFVDAVTYQKARPSQVTPPPAPPVKPLETAPLPPVEPTRVRKSVEKQPSADECFLEGKKLADKMHWVEALQWLNRAVRQNPLLLEAHFTRAMIFINLYRYTEALEALRHAIYIDRGFVMAHFNMGLLHQRQGHSKEASRAWKIAQEYLTQLDPDEILPHSDGITASYLLTVMKNSQVGER